MISSELLPSTADFERAYVIECLAKLRNQVGGLRYVQQKIKPWITILHLHEEGLQTAPKCLDRGEV